jgi:tetratricopeptide (TPR) repeat protein
VGEALVGRGEGALDAEAATLAHHFTLGGDDARSFEYQLRAARAAARISALEAALAHYDAALESADRLGLSSESDERMRELPLERGWVRHMSGDGEAAVADYGAALESARSAGDRPLEAKALDQLAFALKGYDIERAIAYHEQALRIAEELREVPAQVSILNRLSLSHSNQLDLVRAVEVGERALELASGTDDEHDRARALDALKLAALELGDLDRLEELTAELEQIERRKGDLWYLQWTLLESSFVPIGRASWDEATARLDEALAVSRRIGEGARPPIHDAIGWLARSRGRFGRALAEGREAIARSEREGRLTPWSAWTRATLGWTLLDLRAAGDAVSVLERGLADAGWRADRFRTAGHLAWARALGGDLAGSGEAAAEAEEELAGLNAPPGGAFLFGFGAAAALARAHLATGRPERGEELLAPFQAAAERSAWPEAAASALLVTGLCRLARREIGEARDLLVSAADLARRHELPGIEWEALAELARLERGDEADGLRRESAAIVERLAADVGDERLAAGLMRAAEG